MIALIIFLPLAHGAVEAWAVGSFDMAVIALALLWAIKAALDQRLILMIPESLWPVVALVATGLVQSLAWTDRTGNRQSFSLDVEATRGTVTTGFFLLVAAVIAANFLMSRERLRVLTRVLVAFGLGLAVFALIQHFTWNGRFYWLRPTASTQPFGPFPNRNHFAGYMELLIGLPVALVATRGVKREARLYYGFAAVMMGLAAVASLSRGGMISLFAEVMFITALSPRVLRRRGEGRGMRTKLVLVGSGAALLVALMIGIAWIGADPVINRLTTGHDARMRPQQAQTFFMSRGWIWRDTWRLIRAHPLVGTGLGAFKAAYPIYSQANGGRGISEAHNDYLQVLADCGVIGAVWAVWFMISVFRAVARSLRSPDPWLARFALGSGASLFGLFTHSLFDFNLQLPSHSLLFLLFSAAVSYIGAADLNPAGGLTKPSFRVSREPERAKK